MERRFYKTHGELRASQDGGSLIISGRAASFGTLSENLGGFRETIARGAFQRSIQSDRDTKCNFNHDNACLLGRTRNKTLFLSESAKGLDFRAILPDTQQARDVYTLVQKRYADSCSFAFSVDGDDGEEWGDCEDPETNQRIGLRTLKQVRLYDCSVLSGDPAYPTGTDVDIDSDDDANDNIFMNKYRSVSSYFPNGVPDSIPAEYRNRLQRSKVIGIGKRNLINFLLS